MSKEKNTDLKLKGIKAAKLYLQRRGMEVLNDEPFECEAGAIEIVAKDEDGALCFIGVTVAESSTPFPACKDEARRMLLEAIAMSFLAERGDEYVDCQVRFDRVDIRVVSDDRALIRHHINML